jgi:hypothetical protein
MRKGKNKISYTKQTLLIFSLYLSRKSRYLLSCSNNIPKKNKSGELRRNAFGKYVNSLY